MITLHALTKVCKLLNDNAVKYVIIGGCAMFIHGYERTTNDIDLLIDASDENMEKLKKALQEVLPDATAELKTDDVRKNVVVRMAGEDLVVDLIQKVGDIGYEEVKKGVLAEKIHGVRIPVADLEGMLKLKKGVRGVDKKDYLFLIGKKQYLQHRHGGKNAGKQK